MDRRRKSWLLRGVILVLVVAAGLALLPEAVRRIAINKIGEATGRNVAIEDVDLNLFTGRFGIRAFRLTEKERQEPFVQFADLRVRLRLLPLLVGHLRIEAVILSSPLVSVVRTGPAEFNFSDLLGRPEDKKSKKGGLDITIGRFSLVGGRLKMEDRAVEPLRQWRAEDLSVEVQNLSTRAGGPGGAAAVKFRLAEAPFSLEASDLRIAPASANAKLNIQKFDLKWLLPYLPPDAPAALQSGILTASLSGGYGATKGARGEGEIRFEELSVIQRGRTAPFVAVPALAFAIKDLAMVDGNLTLGRAEGAGDPSLFDTNVAPALRFDLKNLKVSLEKASWPEQGPAHLQVGLSLPKGGTVNVDGSVRLAPIGADLRMQLKGADLTPYRPYMPIAAPLSGIAGADLSITASMEGGLTATVRGEAGLDRLALGSAEAPTVAVEKVTANGLDIQWPAQVAVKRLQLQKPSVLIERDEKGEFPLRAMFARPGKEPQEPPAKTAEKTSGSAEAPAKKLAIEITEVVVEEGYGRFVDRSGGSPYTEELSRLALNLKGLSNAPGKRGQLALQSVVGATGALDLRGEVAPLADVLFVDLEGELRDFAIPRVNPYSNRLLAWIAREGQLTTKVRFRVEGDQLDARSDIVIGRLDLAQAGEDDQVKQKVGLPLGLIVALIKDVRGEIRVGVPVSGNLSSPQFSLGEAIWSAVRNAIVNILTAPFQLIGRLFTKDDKITGFSIDPVRFAAGSAAINEAMDQQLRRLGDFLRNSPFVRLSLSPVLSETDVTSLKTQEVTARIQRLQREQQLPDLAAAARRLFLQKFPNRPVPESVEGMAAALRETEASPDEQARKLALRRVEAVRERLTRTAGIDGKRLETAGGSPPADAKGDGRVEFSILP